MGDRGNICIKMNSFGEDKGEVYLYTHWKEKKNKMLSYLFIFNSPNFEPQKFYRKFEDYDSEEECKECGSEIIKYGGNSLVAGKEFADYLYAKVDSAFFNGLQERLNKLCDTTQN